MIDSLAELGMHTNNYERKTEGSIFNEGEHEANSTNDSRWETPRSTCIAGIVASR